MAGGERRQERKKREGLEETQGQIDAADARVLEVLIGRDEDEAGEDSRVGAEYRTGEDDCEDDAGDRIEGGRQAQVEGGYFGDAGEAIERDGGPVEERRLVHRRAAVLEREEQGVVLDHLLEEDGLDRLVGAADVGGAEVMERGQGGDRDDRGAGEQSASAYRDGG